MTEVKSFTSTNKFRLEKIPAYNTPVRQEVKKTRKGVFLFLRRRKEDSSSRFAWSDSEKKDTTKRYPF